MRYWTLLPKYIVIATILYLIWIPLANIYWLLLLKTSAAYFNIVGYNVALATVPEQYVTNLGRFGMFSCIPPFTALILITPKLKPLKRISIAMFIISIVFFIEAIRIILYSYYIYFDVSFGLFSEVMNYFLPTCNVAVPFLIWAGLAYKEVLFKKSGIKN